MKVLVTGGAGYIGSHTVKMLLKEGHQVSVIDNLTTGNRWAVPEVVSFHKLDLGDTEAVWGILDKGNFEAVCHFAASIEVEESVHHPEKYFLNNTVKTANFALQCVKAKIPHFVFSSTAATYGEPEVDLISEETPQKPINPYGQSKVLSEQFIRSLSESLGEKFRYVFLRYFNVAGAAVDGEIGQAYPKPTHLVKVAALAATGKKDGITIFGKDYPTEDGTCVRDYIFIDDLAQAHVDALNYLKKGGESNVFNCGYGKGYSVQEVLDEFQKVNELKLNIDEGPKRDGDPAKLIADNKKIKEILGWKPKYEGLSTICKTAYQWELKLDQINK